MCPMESGESNGQIFDLHQILKGKKLNGEMYPTERRITFLKC